MDEELKGDIVYWAAFYEHRLRLGSKAIFHLEGTFSRPGFFALRLTRFLLPAFCAKIMSTTLPLSLHRRR